FDLLRLALDLELDRAIRRVLHPADQAQLPRPIPGRGPIEHALHAPGHARPGSHPSVRHRSSSPFRDTTSPGRRSYPNGGGHEASPCAVVPLARARLMHLTDLKQKSREELAAVAAQLGIADAGGLRRQALLFAILRAEGRRQVDIHAEGVLEVLADGFG